LESSKSPHEALHWQWGNGWAVREGNWKLLLNEDGTRPELYEFSKTTDERQNLAEQHPEITKRMTDKLLTWYGSLPTSKSFSTGIVK
jgi:hypothetical protein